MKKTRGIIIATAVAASLAVGACSQKPPKAGSARMVKSAHSCEGMKSKARCKANSCKANSCKGKKGRTCSAKNGCSGKK